MQGYLFNLKSQPISDEEKLVCLVLNAQPNDIEMLLKQPSIVLLYRE
jgi:hypothetical protein